MSFDFSVFQSEQLDEDFVQWMILDQGLDRLLQFARLRGYYENQSPPSCPDRRERWRRQQPSLSPDAGVWLAQPDHRGALSLLR